MEKDKRRPIVHCSRVPHRKSRERNVKNENQKRSAIHLLENSWKKRKRHCNDGTKEGMQQKEIIVKQRKRKKRDLKFQKCKMSA